MSKRREQMHLENQIGIKANNDAVVALTKRVDDALSIPRVIAKQAIIVGGCLTGAYHLVWLIQFIISFFRGGGT